MASDVPTARGAAALAFPSRLRLTGEAARPDREAAAMMVLPFVALALAFGLAWTGRRPAAIALWILSIGIMLVLFRMHATDVLPLDF